MNQGAPPTGMKLWVAGARPRTLPAAVVPVVVGTPAAAGVLGEGAGKGLTLWRFLAAMVVAIAIQVGGGVPKFPELAVSVGIK